MEGSHQVDQSMMNYDGKNSTNDARDTFWGFSFVPFCLIHNRFSPIKLKLILLSTRYEIILLQCTDLNL